MSTSVLFELHPDLRPISFLLGRWAGEGRGEYPTIEPFDFGEEVTFSHMGKPFFAYTQRSWSLDEGAPMHTEMGYWRCRSSVEGALVDVVVAHPTGHMELSEGSLEGSVLTLSSVRVEKVPGAKDVARIVRRLAVRGDELSYELDMMAVGRELVPHLRGVLRRVAGP